MSVDQTRDFQGKPTKIEAVQRCTVHILVEQKDKEHKEHEKRKVFGTGFLVAPRRIITNTHVLKGAIKDFEEKVKKGKKITVDVCFPSLKVGENKIAKNSGDLKENQDKPTIKNEENDKSTSDLQSSSEQSGKGTKGTFAKAEVVFANSTDSKDNQLRDIAGLFLTKPIKCKPVRLKKINDRTPSALYRGFGFPWINEPKLADNNIEVLDATLYFPDNNSWWHCSYKRDVHLGKSELEGYSGGPLFDSQGQIIGMMTLQTLNADRLVIIPSALLLKSWSTLRLYQFFRTQVNLTRLGSVRVVVTTLVLLLAYYFLAGGILAEDLRLKTVDAAFEQHDYIKAQDSISKALFWRPRKASLYYHLAWVLEEKDPTKFEDITKYYNKAITYGDRQGDIETVFDARNNLARYLCWQEKPDVSDIEHALSEIERAFSSLSNVNKHTQDIEASILRERNLFKNRGCLYMKQGNFSLAKADLEGATKKERYPEDGEAYCLLAELQDKLGENSYPAWEKVLRYELDAENYARNEICISKAEERFLDSLEEKDE